MSKKYNTDLSKTTEGGASGALDMDAIFAQLYKLKSRREVEPIGSTYLRGGRVDPVLLWKPGIPFSYGSEDRIIMSPDGFRRARKAGIVS
jgi:hypothetical protein